MAQTTPPVPPIPPSPAAEGFPISPRLAPIHAAPDTSKPLPPLQIEATASGKSVMYTHPLLVVIECGLLQGCLPGHPPLEEPYLLVIPRRQSGQWAMEKDEACLSVKLTT
jgi:hypothetical protein